MNLHFTKEGSNEEQKPEVMEYLNKLGKKTLFPASQFEVNWEEEGSEVNYEQNLAKEEGEFLPLKLVHHNGADFRLGDNPTKILVDNDHKYLENYTNPEYVFASWSEK